MKLEKLLSEVKFPVVPVTNCLRSSAKMPPLQEGKIFVEGLVGEMRRRLKTPFTGDASIVLNYKGREGALGSFAELNDGDVWEILQIQGATGKGAYRLTAGLDWPVYLGGSILALAHDVRSQVRHVMMPDFASIKGAIEVADPERLQQIYASARRALKMSWSKELNRYVVDI